MAKSLIISSKSALSEFNGAVSIMSQPRILLEFLQQPFDCFGQREAQERSPCHGKSHPQAEARKFKFIPNSSLPGAPCDSPAFQTFD